MEWDLLADPAVGVAEWGACVQAVALVVIVFVPSAEPLFLIKEVFPVMN